MGRGGSDCNIPSILPESSSRVGVICARDYVLQHIRGKQLSIVALVIAVQLCVATGYTKQEDLWWITAPTVPVVTPIVMKK